MYCKVLVVGAGPCGLRAAFECRLLSSRVIVVEMRDYISRNNVLHLWPFVIQDLKSIGAKMFYPKFCTGSLDHTGIRTLQTILLKLCLIIGVEVYTPVKFLDIVYPETDENGVEKAWRARFEPESHSLHQVEFDFMIGADGKRNTLPGFQRKCFRGKPALGITANFFNYKTSADNNMEEIGGIFYIFYQEFFSAMREALGIDLENFVYYKNETHYFVMTARKKCLLDRGVLKQDQGDQKDLLHTDNIDRSKLEDFALDAATFSTKNKLPRLDFAVNHHGEKDVAIFDFTAFYQANNSCRALQRNGRCLFLQIVGDTLIELFWPTGSGIARGFLGVYDAAWAIRSWCLKDTDPLDVILQRELVYQFLSQTKPDTLNSNISKYTIDPSTRYGAKLKTKPIKRHQMAHLFDTDNATCPLEVKPQEEQIKRPMRKRHHRSASVDGQMLVAWFQDKLLPLRQMVNVTNLSSDWYDGVAFCALIQIYRPHMMLGEFSSLNTFDSIANNDFAFSTFEEEFGLSPMLTAGDMVKEGGPDKLTLLSYLVQLQAALQQQPVITATDVQDDQPPARKRRPSAVGLLARLNHGSLSSLAEVPRGGRREKSADEELKRENRLSVRDMKKLLDQKAIEDEVKRAKQFRRPSQTGVAPDQSSATCCVCEKTLFIVEQQSAFGYFFHRHCFRCLVCKCNLLVNMAVHETDSEVNKVKFYCFRHGFEAGLSGDMSSPMSHASTTVHQRNELSNCCPLQDTEKDIEPQSDAYYDLSEADSIDLDKLVEINLKALRALDEKDKETNSLVAADADFRPAHTETADESSDLVDEEDAADCDQSNIQSSDNEVDHVEMEQILAARRCSDRRNAVADSTIQQYSESLRLLMQCDIQQGLQQVEEDAEMLEQRGLSIEKSLRDGDDNKDLINEWLDVLNCKQHLKNKESYLLLQARLMELQDQQRRLHGQLKFTDNVDNVNEIHIRMQQLDGEEQQVMERLRDVGREMEELNLGLNNLSNSDLSSDSD